jgi:hypothetical protein
MLDHSAPNFCAAPPMNLKGFEFYNLVILLIDIMYEPIMLPGPFSGSVYQRQY